MSVDATVTGDVWLLETPLRYVDGLGRGLGWPGSTLLAQAVATVPCLGDHDRICSTRRVPDGRSRCTTCEAWWTVAQVARSGAIARSLASVGIDIEDRRHRPAALRRASVFCGVRLTSMEQWTQGEALWKALGLGRRPPRLGEVSVPETWVQGWQLSRDARWWLYTDGQGAHPWSLALPGSSAEPPNLHVVVLPLPGAAELTRTSQNRPASVGQGNSMKGGADQWAS